MTTVYLNGEYLPLERACVSVTDYGFLFGYGLYETMRGYDSKFFRLDCHLERLRKAAETLAIRLDTAAVRDAVLETARRNPLASARMRITVTAGAGNPVANLATCPAPTVLVVALNYTPYSAEVYARGYRTIVSSLHRNSQSVLAGMKISGIVESLIARRDAQAAGVDDAILLNDKGYLAEASSSNVFIVSRGILKTARLGEGLLPGVTRAAVLELAKELGIKCSEEDIAREELSTAEEMFLTNSMVEIMPVTSLNGKAVGSGKPGTMTKRLMEAYRKMVERESS